MALYRFYTEILAAYLTWLFGNILRNPDEDFPTELKLVDRLVMKVEGTNTTMSLRRST
jgi:hypothetical protein